MKILYGGDYNPEQWPEAVWKEDYRLFDAASIDTVTLGVFTWALTQPSEEVYDFGTLDAVVGRAVAEGRTICLATGTGAHPAWMARAYPEVTRVDFEGRRHRFGQRHNSCPSSPAFRRLSARVAGEIAARYHDVVDVWHVGNEFGGACYCDLCAAGFRAWLRDRYGSLDALNDAWYARFWSHVFGDWDEIEPPSALTEHWRGPDHTAFQGITLDYLRFMSDAMRANFRDEKAAVRAHSAAPVTTNLMGMYKPIDYHRWAADLDLVSWDNYPPDDTSQARMAFTHDLMRGLRGGAPFWLMEQTPSITASRVVNPLKRPGVLRLWSWQAVAHGADAVLYFQLRAGRGACEKYHGAVIGHAGRDDTRVFREVAALGHELAALGDVTIGARTPARVAILFDWDSWWALEMTDGLNRHLRYPEIVLAYHRAVWDCGADVDAVPVTADLTGYDVVLAPALHLLDEPAAARLSDVAARGGTVITTFLTGLADPHARAHLGDPPLTPLLGIRVDEWDSRDPSVSNPVTLNGAAGEPSAAPTGGPVVDARLHFDLITPLTAAVEGVYGADFYAGTPAVTRNAFGDGEAWHVGTALDRDGVSWVVRRALARHHLVGPYADLPDLETATRVSADGMPLLFLLNHRDEPLEITADRDGTDLLTGRPVTRGAPVRLAARDVAIIARAPAESAERSTDCLP